MKKENEEKKLTDYTLGELFSREDLLYSREIEDKINSIRVIKQLNNIARETGKRYFTFQSKEFITYFIKVNDFGRTFFRSFDINNLTFAGSMISYKDKYYLNINIDTSCYLDFSKIIINTIDLIKEDEFNAKFKEALEIKLKELNEFNNNKNKEE